MHLVTYHHWLYYYTVVVGAHFELFCTGMQLILVFLITQLIFLCVYYQLIVKVQIESFRKKQIEHKYFKLVHNPQRQNNLFGICIYLVYPPSFQQSALRAAHRLIQEDPKFQWKSKFYTCFVWEWIFIKSPVKIWWVFFFHYVLKQNLRKDFCLSLSY